MSAPQRKAYRFRTAAHWARCVTHRFDVTPDGLAPIPRLAAHASRLTDGGPVSAIAADPHGVLFWRRDGSGGLAGVLRLDDESMPAGPFEVEGAIASSLRWIIDRQWIWAFVPGDRMIHRYERDTLQHDFSIDVAATIRDVATDGKQGAWLLVEGGGGTLLIQIDCRGCRRRCHPVPNQASDPGQVGSVSRGRVLVLLGAGGRLLFLDAKSGAITRAVNAAELAPGWSPTHLSTDGRDRIAVWCDQASSSGPTAIVFVLDAAGDTIDGPIPAPNETILGLAIRRDVIWFGTGTGVWRLGAGSGQDARESESTLLTPVLLSPDSDPVRGWLRAEVLITLPRGAVLEAEFRTTDVPRCVADAQAIAANPSTTAEQKLAATWDLFPPDPSRRFRFVGPASPDQPLAIPLFSSRDRWLWLRLNVMTPPGADASPLQELRVLYPEASIAQYLPAAFRGERTDPTGFMRRLVGVLESTTQGLDDRIAGIGAHVDPSTTPSTWHDYLARWLDLPWDDGLPSKAKRALLVNAGELLDKRATRRGLRTLLRCLLDSDAVIHDLTVDYDASFLGGRGRAGGRLPMLLAGAYGPSLGEKAILGRARLCAGSDPLDVIAPTVRLELVADAETRRAIEPLLERVLVQYIPAGMRTDIRWLSPAFDALESHEDGMVLDAAGPGALGRDSALGRTVVGGRPGRPDDCGLSSGFTLR